MKQINELEDAEEEKLMGYIEITSVPICGSVSDEVNQAIADFGPTYYEMIGKADL